MTLTPQFDIRQLHSKLVLSPLLQYKFINVDPRATEHGIVSVSGRRIKIFNCQNNHMLSDVIGSDAPSHETVRRARGGTGSKKTTLTGCSPWHPRCTRGIGITLALHRALVNPRSFAVHPRDLVHGPRAHVTAREVRARIAHGVPGIDRSSRTSDTLVSEPRAAARRGV